MKSYNPIKVYHDILGFCEEFGYSKKDIRDALRRFSEKDEVGREKLGDALNGIDPARKFYRSSTGANEDLKSIDKEFGVYGLILAISCFSSRNEKYDPEKHYWNVYSDYHHKDCIRFLRMSNVRSNSRIDGIVSIDL